MSTVFCTAFQGFQKSVRVSTVERHLRSPARTRRESAVHFRCGSSPQHREPGHESTSVTSRVVETTAQTPQASVVAGAPASVAGASASAWVAGASPWCSEEPRFMNGSTRCDESMVVPRFTNDESVWVRILRSRGRPSASRLLASDTVRVSPPPARHPRCLPAA